MRQSSKVHAGADGVSGVTDWVSIAADFASRHVAGLPELNTSEEFPADLWAEMGRAGLLGCILPEEYGGGGAGCRELQEAGEAFVRTGGCLGLATAWFGHALVARYFLAGFGDDGQKSAWLPEIAAGRVTASVAISEPGAGAHPKHLTTKAEVDGEAYRISGEKFYVTNGNIAGLFAVLAITKSIAGKKRYSALLVPRDTPGLQVEAMPPLDYLRPSQHVRLRLNGCAVPEDHLLGPGNEAFEAMARPFRDVEDVMGAGPLLGAMCWQLDALLAQIRGGPQTDSALEEKLGGLEVRLEGCRVLAAEGARLLDAWFSRPVLSGKDRHGHQDSVREDGTDAGTASTDGLARISLATRAAMREFQSALGEAVAACGGAENPPLEAMTRELSRIAKAPGAVALLKQRKIGAALLRGTD